MNLIKFTQLDRKELLYKIEQKCLNKKLKEKLQTLKNYRSNEYS